MNIEKQMKIILAELQSCALPSRTVITIFIERILAANRIFLAGKGRSGLAIAAFANRLMHLGLPVSVTGEITCPHTQKDDLIIIASGSGETGSLIKLAEKGKAAGVFLILLTANAGSTLAIKADLVIDISGRTKGDNSKSDFLSSQPMGTSFEQLVWLLGDAIILELMGFLEEDEKTMKARHTDLE